MADLEFSLIWGSPRELFAGKDASAVRSCERQDTFADKNNYTWTQHKTAATHTHTHTRKLKEILRFILVSSVEWTMAVRIDWPNHCCLPIFVSRWDQFHLHSCIESCTELMSSLSLNSHAVLVYYFGSVVRSGCLGPSLTRCRDRFWRVVMAQNTCCLWFVLFLLVNYGYIYTFYECSDLDSGVSLFKHVLVLLCLFFDLNRQCMHVAVRARKSVFPIIIYLSRSRSESQFILASEILHCTHKLFFKPKKNINKTNTKPKIECYQPFISP